MRILFVTNTPPFPSRDGVKVVSSHYVEEFKKRGAGVDLLFLRRPKEHFDEEELNRSIFNRVYSCSIRRVPRVRSILRQVMGGAPYFAQWQLDGEAVDLSSNAYDLVWATPRSVLKVVAELRGSGSLRCSKVLGGVNDIASLRFARMANGWEATSTYKEKLRKLGFCVQSVLLEKSEIRLLGQCDFIHVQTKEESDWIMNKCPKDMHAKAIVRANGVDDCFFDLPLRRKSHGLVFVGAMDGMYLERIKWFIERCLPPLREHIPGLSVTIIGRCSNQGFVDSLSDYQIEYRAFVEDVSELYDSYRVLVAPIFKGYGLINKVIQAMAAGTLVVGDKTAYNGIPGFEAGIHGFVANDSHAFVEQILTALSDDSKVEQVQNCARGIISKNFRWSECADHVLSCTTVKNCIAD